MTILAQEADRVIVVHLLWLFGAAIVGMVVLGWVIDRINRKH